MNKGLFCALCCIGVAGYAAKKRASENILDAITASVVTSSPEVTLLKGIGAVYWALENGCHFFDQWEQYKENLTRSFLRLEPLYKDRITIKLIDNLSPEKSRRLSKINEDIAALEKDVVTQLTDLHAFVYSEDYFQYTHDVGSAARQICFDATQQQDD